MSRLFEPLTLRGTTVRNRVWVSPMCQYSSVEGHPTDWHLVHLGGFARGGAGLVMTEATAVTPEGRISPADAGIWTDAQAADHERIATFLRGQGATPAMQLAHAGRKASALVPWHGRGVIAVEDGGWPTVGPSPIGYADWPAPQELDAPGIATIVDAFAAAAARAVAAGFEVLELHAAHGYLLHEFLSPLTNVRTDSYGGDLAGRSRFLVEAVDAVRAAIPDRTALLVRLSATDWADGGLTVEEVAEVSTGLGGHGVDLIDVSSGGNVPEQRITTGPGYQVPFAETVRKASGLPVAAVGEITDARQAEAILAGEQADAVLLARALLRDPSWPQHAAQELGDDVYWPDQYLRARPTPSSSS